MNQVSINDVLHAFLDDSGWSSITKRFHALSNNQGPNSGSTYFFEFEHVLEIPAWGPVFIEEFNIGFDSATAKCNDFMRRLPFMNSLLSEFVNVHVTENSMRTCGITSR